MELAMKESCEFMPFLSPKNVRFTPGGNGSIRSKKIRAIEFVRTEQDENGKWVEDPEQTVTVKVNYIISAFGSGLNDTDGEWEVHCALYSSQHPRL